MSASIRPTTHARVTHPSVAGVRFQRVGKLYHFNVSGFPLLELSDFVIVHTTRGLQMGQVVKFVPGEQAGDTRALKAIERVATPADLLLRQSWEARETEAMIECRARAHTLGLPCKIVRAEYSFDGSLLTFLYSSDDKLDLAALRRDMARQFRTGVEMRQIGPRDVAKILGGMGACGLETRCCSMFLTEFSPISIKMAKEQGISLNPDEITGMCGRLRCCLVYEYEQYVTARKSLPKRGKRVRTVRGDGKVVDINPLRESIYVLLVIDDQETVVEFPRSEFEPLDELEALQKKSQSPCDRHEGGGCTCGADATLAADLAHDRWGNPTTIIHVPATFRNQNGSLEIFKP